MKLSSLKQLSEQDLQSMAAIRAKVEKLLEFQKEVENQLPLRSKVLNVGRQLMMSSSYNTTGLGDRLQGYETEWAELQRDIVHTEETLHQAQMDLMPSRQALHELAEWLDIIRTQLQEDKNKPIHSLADMEVMLKKYKGYKIELSSKQLTVDFVNQQVLQPHIPEEDAEKLDFAEKLGEFNRQWKIFTSDVNERLRTLERLSSKFEDFEKLMSRLKLWFREQEDKIKNYGHVGHTSGVRQTLSECKELQRQLKAKESDIQAAKSLAESLIDLSVDSPGCQRGVQDSLDGLNRQWLHLEEQLGQLENTLEGMLGEWGHYSSQLQALMQMLTNIDYCLNRYTLVGGDISTLTDQVNKLRTLEAELHHHEPQRDAFLALCQQLTKVSDAPISADIQKTAADVQNKWRRLSADLSTRRKQFEQFLQRWQNYESEYDSIRRWLDDKEKICHGLTTCQDDPTSRRQCLEQSKTLQAEFDNIQSRVSQLCHLSDDLAKSMEPSSILMMTSRHSGLEQRLLGLRHVLAQNMEALQDDLTSLEQFRDAFEVLRIFLDHAEVVLEQADPNKSSDEIDLRDRLNQLKDLQTQFTNNYAKLDSLNIMGYKLALGDRDAQRLSDLNHRWHRLYSCCGERSKSLQANVLVQQDFSSKCDSWMTFLAQTEQDLAVDIAGNLVDLRDQQKMCQKFDSEMYSRQQVLHAIISDGGKMLQAGDIDDPAEFQQKLHLLSEQWRSVVRRANQRKVIIDNSIQQWNTYNNLSQQLRVWLEDKTMQEFEFETASLQQINSMLQKVKTTQQEFQLQEHSFRQIHEIGRDLQQRADPVAKDQVKVNMEQLERSWCDSYSRLEHHRLHLEELLQEWQECEEDIDDILAWLRETRQILAADLPTVYDNLQADLNNSKDIATSFANSEDRRQQLLSRERNLSRRIHSEDMNVLAQRIRLLNKQWNELASQTLLREQRLRDAMCRWSGFSDQVQDFLDWIKDMEITVTTSLEMHVEDLLNRLETEVQDKLMAKEREKNQLMDQGHRLMKVSSDIRASDIEHRIEKLDDRWQHLQSVVSFRKRKLHETVLAVRQLDISMRNLSRWLSDMEQEVGGAIVYSDCDWQEIQTKIHQQQELQKDIEQHSAGVASVLNLCEVLLHDSDACPTDIEYNALQHARKTLDQRLRSICKLSPERRARIEESWQLWEVFKQDCKTFSDWLIDVETEVGTYSVEDVSVELTKEEIRKYETLQRNVLNHLGELEHINKQYRRLAREGRTDTNGSLRASMQDVNDRWDHLQKRVTSIMKCLRNSTSIRTDFSSTQTSLMTWLIEIESQLNTIQRHSSGDMATQQAQISRLVEEINSKRSRFEYLDQSAVYLMQKGDADEVVQVQGDLEEIRRRWKQVLEQATVYNIQVSSTTQIEETRLFEQRSTMVNPDEEEMSVTSVDVRRRQMQDTSATVDLDVTELEAYLASSPPESPPQKRRTMPRSSTLDTDASKRVEKRQKMKSELGQKGKTAKYDPLLNKLGDAIEDAAGKLLVAERQISSGADSSSLHSYRSDCERAIETVQRLEQRLKSETGQTRMNYLDTQVRSVVQRWEILQLRVTEREYKVVTERQDQTQFRVDLDNMLAWLDEAEALQSAQQPLPGDMAELESVIRQYKDFLVQLESKKARVLSINLISKNFINLSTADGRDMQEKLRQMNERWEAVNSRADSVHRGLQVALLQSQEFHHEIHDRYMWLESIENRMQKCEPIKLNADETHLWLQYNRLMELHGELERNQPKILAIKDTTDQLYMNTDSQEMVNAKDKMHIIANRVRALLRLTSSYISSLENKLHISARASPANLDVSDVSSGTSRGSRSSSPRSSLLRPGSSLRVRNRSPFALSRQFKYRT
ncbi:nesprin-1-like isoform X2 [Haliotis rubra]|uniref:nesprin-1-like isoform X2 n=1 Tax=Haliotis rubra TaxID=36100 RepID=UPI001EE5815F|nr:nesprin-1-like isoform X2 [Haliotis rubra]